MSADRYRLIDNRNVEYSDERVRVADLVLDPTNPRIQHELQVRLGSEPTDQELDQVLWEREQVKRLRAAIKQDGGVSEPLFVRKLENGKYLVIEGNQRTVAMRHLQNETSEDSSSFRTVPAWVFGDDLSSAEVAVLLADLHVAGKDQWRPYEQAKHIFELSDVYGKSYDWLATKLRLSKSQVMQKLSAYKAFDEFLRQYGDSDPTKISKFSFFEELYKKRKIKEMYEGDPDFKRTFMLWVNGGKLVDAKDVRELPVILDNDDARGELDARGIKAAREILIKHDPTRASDLLAGIKSATDIIREARMSEVNDLKDRDPKKVLLVRELYRAIQDLATTAGISL